MDFFTGGSVIMDYKVNYFVDYCDFFPPIHCRGSISEQVMQCYIFPNLMKKHTHPHLGQPEGEYIFSKF